MKKHIKLCDFIQKLQSLLEKNELDPNLELYIIGPEYKILPISLILDKYYFDGENGIDEEGFIDLIEDLDEDEKDNQKKSHKLIYVLNCNIP